MAAAPTAEDNRVDPGSLLTSGSSAYKVQSFLGKGSFGKVVKCKRLADNQIVAIKMIELKACNVKSTNQEVAALKKLRSLDSIYLVKWFQFFSDRGHVCLEFEHLDKSLQDFMRERSFRPLPLKDIRPIVQQIAHALNQLKAEGIVHADLKLENVMLVDQIREPFRVKVIDFGLAFDVSAAKLGSNIQTRQYRSPEIMLAHPFTEAIDMWSLGCMAAAMYLGFLLYPGLGEYEMIKFITETQGQLPSSMLDRGRKTQHFFVRNVNSNTTRWNLKTPEEYRKDTGRQPMENRCLKFTSLDGLLHTRPISSQNSADVVAEMADANMFVDMLKAMLQLDPDRRITPRQVLEHSFISMRHMARMDNKSHYVRCVFQRMLMCQRKIATPGTGTSVCGPLKAPRDTATKPVHPPSLAEGRKTIQPPLPDRHPCTSTTQTRETEGSRKRKIKHDDLPPQKNRLPPLKSRHDARPNGHPQSDQRTRPGPQSDQRTRPGPQSDRRTRPAEDHRHDNKTAPPGSSRAEGHALSGQKRKRDNDDVRPRKKTSLPHQESAQRTDQAS